MEKMMSTKTLLVDGQWNLKRNFFKRKNCVSNGENCGGVFGFLDSLRVVIDRILPSRVIVFWDGFNSGKLRYEIYKPYKANRNKDFEKEKKVITGENLTTQDETDDYDILRQKIRTQNYLEELFIRQLEVDLIEADDLIGYYILSSRIPNEEIVIYSRDGDFLQLVDRNVSILTPDSLEVITYDNFKSKFGYIPENALLIKCFEGDTSDKIGGVIGVTKENLLEHFPRLSEEKYKYDKMVEEAYEKKLKHKVKYYDKIINARSILYRNADLMNLRKPFVNEEAKEKMDNIIYGVLDDDRKIGTAIKSFVKDGFTQFVGNKNIDTFFSTFYRIMNRENEYKNN